MAKTKESFKTSLTDSSQTLHLFPGSRFFLLSIECHWNLDSRTFLMNNYLQLRTNKDTAQETERPWPSEIWFSGVKERRGSSSTDPTPTADACCCFVEINSSGRWVCIHYISWHFMHFLPIWNIATDSAHWPCCCHIITNTCRLIAYTCCLSNEMVTASVMIMWAACVRSFSVLPCLSRLFW